MQVDYASAALFLNISMHVSGTSEAPVAWWQHPELRMKAGLDPHTQASRHAAQPHAVGTIDLRLGAAPAFWQIAGSSLTKFYD